MLGIVDGYRESEESWKELLLDLKQRKSVLAVAILVFLPLLLDNWLSATNQHHTELLRVHECSGEICVVDFDADGTLGRILIDRSSSIAPHEYWLIVKENGKELIRLPYWELDTNARTHVATNQSAGTGKTRLLLYEHKGGDAPIINTVYELNGSQMVQITPSDYERELFNAMASTDQNGTYNRWTLYRLVRMPLLTIYYLILVLVTCILAAKARIR